MCIRDSNVNVALNRPSFQAATVTGASGNIYHARYANDGNHETHLKRGPCATTDGNGGNPWWAVDLGVPLYVHSVKFTNRNRHGTYTVSSLSI